MALMTSPMLMVLPSLLVRNMVLCPEFVTDIGIGGMAAGLCSVGAGGLAGGYPVGTDCDVVGTGGATGLGA